MYARFVIIAVLAAMPALPAVVVAAGPNTSTYRALYFAGDYIGALDAVDRSIDEAKREDSSGTTVALLLRDKGEIEHELGKMPAAIASYESAISRLSTASVTSRRTIALLRLELAELQRLNGAYAEAAKSYEAAQPDISRHGAVLGTFEGVTPLNSDGLLSAQLLAQVVDLWSPGQRMLANFGRYTLVLMTQGDPTRNAAFVTRLMNRFGDPQDPKRVVDRIRGQSIREGIFYLPVIKRARFNARALLVANTTAAEKWEEISRLYNFSTARALYVDICSSTRLRMASLCRQSMPRGPLLITTAYPVNKSLLSESPILITDLSYADSDDFDPLIDQAVRKISEPAFSSVSLLERVRAGFLQALLTGAQAATATRSAISEIIVLRNPR